MASLDQLLRDWESWAADLARFWDELLTHALDADAPGEAAPDLGIVADGLEDVGMQVDLIKFDIEGVEDEVFSHSRRVHEVKHIVGEMKAALPEVEKLRSLFPGHDAKIRQAAKHMYMIDLHHKDRREDPWRR